MGNLHISKGTINAELYRKKHKQAKSSFSGRGYIVSARQCQATFSMYYKQHGFVVTDGTDLGTTPACLQSRTVTH